MESINVNTRLADDIVQKFSSAESSLRKHAHQTLKDLRQVVRSRQKRIRTFNLMVAAVDRQYSVRQSLARRQLAQFETVIADLHLQMAQLKQQRSEQEQALSMLEQNLQAERAYAQQRQTKKAKREKQYNQYYFVPLLKDQYQKKYMRARDKNAYAEEQVAQVREDIETSQSIIRLAATQIGEKQQELDGQISLRQETHDQVVALDGCMARLHEGQQFWARFNQYQAELLLEACDRLLMHQLQQQQERDWTVVFWSVCKEYEEREAYGVTQYDQFEVDFECARCRQSVIGCPMPDKVHTSDLLCADCYQETRTSMVMEKKMMAIGGKLGIDQRRPEGPRRLSSSSRISTATSSSSGSTLVEGAKHAFKAIINPNKKGRTSALADDLCRRSQSLTFILINKEPPYVGIVAFIL